MVFRVGYLARRLAVVRRVVVFFAVVRLAAVLRAGLRAAVFFRVVVLRGFAAFFTPAIYSLRVVLVDMICVRESCTVLHTTA